MGKIGEFNGTCPWWAKWFESIDHSVFREPLPWSWIWGTTIFATLVTAMMIAADVAIALRRGKLWTPPQFFTLNAAIITLLAIAAKVPEDSDMPGFLNQVLKLGGMMFLTLSMSHLMPSLGLMSGGAILANTTAMGIVVVSIAAYIWFQILRFHANLMTKIGAWITASYTLVMLFTYSTLVSYALSATSLRRRLEIKYRSRHEDILREVDVNGRPETASDSNPIISIETLKICLNKYWVMALTSNPDMLLLTTYSYCAAPVLHAFTLMTYLWVYYFLSEWKHCFEDFDYNRTVGALLYIHLFADIAWLPVVLVRAFVMFHASRLRVDEMLERLMFIEAYKMEAIEEWREHPLPFRVRSRTVMAVAFLAKDLGLELLALFQLVVSFLSRLLALVLTCVSLALFGISISCKGKKSFKDYYFKYWKKKTESSAERGGVAGDENYDQYILLPERGDYILNFINNKWHNVKDPSDWIRYGSNTKNKLDHLLKLLTNHKRRVHFRIRGSSNTSNRRCRSEAGSSAVPIERAVRKGCEFFARHRDYAPFNKEEVLCNLPSQWARSTVPHDKCYRSWSLQLATLHCIVHVASPATTDRADWVSLTDTIDRCFPYSLMVDSVCTRATTEVNGARTLLKSLADRFPCVVVDDGIDFAAYEKEVTAAKMVRQRLLDADSWLDVDLRMLPADGDAKTTVRELTRKAMESLENYRDHNRNEWPLTAFAADSMREIAGSMLEAPGFNFSYEKLEAKIAETLGMCLHCLPLAILYECSNGGYGLRETHVQLAATVLGETNEILEFLETECNKTIDEGLYV